MSATVVPGSIPTTFKFVILFQVSHLIDNYSKLQRFFQVGTSPPPYAHWEHLRHGMPSGNISATVMHSGNISATVMPSGNISATVMSSGNISATVNTSKNLKLQKTSAAGIDRWSDTQCPVGHCKTKYVSDITTEKCILRGSNSRGICTIGLKSITVINLPRMYVCRSTYIYVRCIEINT